MTSKQLNVLSFKLVVLAMLILLIAEFVNEKQRQQGQSKSPSFLQIYVSTLRLTVLKGCKCCLIKTKSSLKCSSLHFLLLTVETHTWVPGLRTSVPSFHFHACFLIHSFFLDYELSSPDPCCSSLTLCPFTLAV